jgi:hypothetical protein
MTNALEHLRSLLRVPEPEAFSPSKEIDAVLLTLTRRIQDAGILPIPEDLQLAAVRRFWESKRLEWRDARLVSFGLRLGASPEGTPIIEDRSRFHAVLSGVDQWVGEPRRYRRCYHGLLTNYFAYDGLHPATTSIGRNNWLALRGYLVERSIAITSKSMDPDWVTCVLDNPQLLGATPAASYAADMLRGADTEVNRIRSLLQIDDSSWFLRELILAQVEASTSLMDAEFGKHVVPLLGILSRTPFLRDRGLALLLDRYARGQNPALHKELRDCAVRWWRNPWLTRNKATWGGVSPQARQMVEDWLKLEFLETFFTLLAEEGTADQRRLDFWKRYVRVIDSVQFALGADARASRDRDFMELRRKMDGATVELHDVVGSNNAFIMTMGEVVLVEFSGRANALYGYDRKQGVPFKLSAPVVSAKDSDNSLKSSQRQLWLKHADGIHGWARWEDMFEATLREHYRLEPQKVLEGNRAVAQLQPQSRTATRGRGRPETPATTTRRAYSRAALEVLATKYQCHVTDDTGRGGSIWVRPPTWNDSLNQILESWGFTYRPGKGWWK